MHTFFMFEAKKKTLRNANFFTPFDAPFCLLAAARKQKQGVQRMYFAVFWKCRPHFKSLLLCFARLSKMCISSLETSVVPPRTVTLDDSFAIGDDDAF